MKEKEIIFLIDTLSGGGTERICVNIANALSERGWSVTLVVMTLKKAVYLEILSDKVTIVELEAGNKRYITFALPLLKFLIRRKNSSFVVFNYGLAVLTLALRSTFKLKIRIIVRNSITLSMRKKITKHSWKEWIIVPLISRLYPRADKIIHQCFQMQKDFITIYPNTEDKCSIIYNPVDYGIEKIAKNTKQTNKEKYFLYAGRLEKQKSVHYTIEAFASARPFLKGNYYLKIVGQGSLEKELKNLVKCLKIEQYVLFEGFKKNIAPYYLKAKATLLSSVCEGFPNVLVESITLGTPVISFDCPSGPGEIINDLNGKLVKTGDVKGLSGAIIDVCNSEYDIESVRSTSHNYRIDKVIKEYEAVFNSLCELVP